MRRCGPSLFSPFRLFPFSPFTPFSFLPFRPVTMRLPYFSRSQSGVILLLGAALLLLIRLAGPPALLPLPSPARDPEPGLRGGHREGAPPRGLCLPEATHPEGGPGQGRRRREPPSDPDKIIASGSRVEVTPEGGYRVAAMSGAQLVTLGLPLDLNRATAQDLDALPGLGPALAQRIVDYRQAHGPFKQIEDLSEVSGIGPQNLPKLKPYLGLGGPEAIAPPDWEAAMTAGKSGSGTYLESQKERLPGSKIGLQPKAPGRVIDPNRASQADLETLPGIGPVLARRIIDYRRVHGPYKKIADLRKVSGIGAKKLEKIKPYVVIN